MSEQTETPTAGCKSTVEAIPSAIVASRHPVQFAYKRGEMVFLQFVNLDEQNSSGYKIRRRFVRRGKPAYQLDWFIWVDGERKDVFGEGELWTQAIIDACLDPSWPPPSPPQSQPPPSRSYDGSADEDD